MENDAQCADIRSNQRFSSALLHLFGELRLDCNVGLLLSAGALLRVFHYDDLTFEEWKQQILEKAHRSETKPLTSFSERDNETSVITYMQSLPLDSFNDSSPANVVVVIDARTIAGLFSGLIDNYGGWVHIHDGKGTRLLFKETWNPM